MPQCQWHWGIHNFSVDPNYIQIYITNKLKFLNRIRTIIITIWWNIHWISSTNFCTVNTNKLACPPGSPFDMAKVYRNCLCWWHNEWFETLPSYTHYNQGFEKPNMQMKLWDKQQCIHFHIKSVCVHSNKSIIMVLGLLFINSFSLTHWGWCDTYMHG